MMPELKTSDQIHAGIKSIKKSPSDPGKGTEGLRRYHPN